LGGDAAPSLPATHGPPWPAVPGTPPRDLHFLRESVRAKLATLPHAERLLAALDGEEEDDHTLGRIFGEELPSGLVLVETT
jgi:hypothetical protein